VDFWNWFFLPLIVLAFGGLVQSFQSPLRRPQRADLFPLVGILFLASDVLDRGSRPLISRILEGCFFALICAAAMVLVFRWALVRVREPAST
jgi:hypothetical protein